VGERNGPESDDGASLGVMRGGGRGVGHRVQVMTVKGVWSGVSDSDCLEYVGIEEGPQESAFVCTERRQGEQRQA
jgi:hypothetical protein